MRSARNTFARRIVETWTVASWFVCPVVLMYSSLVTTIARLVPDPCELLNAGSYENPYSKERTRPFSLSTRSWDTCQLFHPPLQTNPVGIFCTMQYNNRARVVPNFEMSSMPRVAAQQDAH
jgi:hypothetical protein